MYVPPFSVLCTTYHYPIKVLFGENIHFDYNINKVITVTNKSYLRKKFAYTNIIVSYSVSLNFIVLYELNNFDYNHPFNGYILPNYHIERSKSNDEKSDKKLPLLSCSMSVIIKTYVNSKTRLFCKHIQLRI